MKKYAQLRQRVELLRHVLVAVLLRTRLPCVGSFVVDVPQGAFLETCLCFSCPRSAVLCCLAVELTGHRDARRGLQTPPPASPVGLSIVFLPSPTAHSMSFVG